MVFVFCIFLTTFDVLDKTKLSNNYNSYHYSEIKKYNE